MPEAVSATTGTQPHRITLNSDGSRHPVQNGLTAFTFVVGVVAFALGIIRTEHVVATILGVVAFIVGLVAQMISATREQRVLIVTGLIGAFVGAAMGIGHGGL
jgi:hypothetical protein